MFWNLFSHLPQPFAEGFLPQENNHSVYFYRFGNPQGIPVISFHGGPGGSARSKYAALFDLKKYQVILFDQRGCGKSEANDDLKDNNTNKTLSDAKRLLEYFKISEKVIVHGCSWGSTLALLFALKYPDMVSKIAVSSVFLARPIDVDWVNRDSERFYPDIWAIMREKVNSRNIFSKYYDLLFSEKEEDNLKALTYLGSYEHMLGQLAPKFEPRTELDEKELRSARIYFYYEHHKFFIHDNEILDNIDKIKHIPTLIVHNRLDFCCPVQQAWELHQALPTSELHIIAGREHSSKQLLKIFKTKLTDFLE